MGQTPRRRWNWDDVTLWAPVVGVVAVSQTKLGIEDTWSGSDGVLTVTSLLSAAPLLARRRWPILTATAVAIALVLQETLGGSLSFGAFIAVLVVTYSAGRHAAVPRAAAGAVIVLVGAAVASRDHLPDDAVEFAFPLFYVSVATVVGAVVRRLREQATRLQALNAALARERDASARLAVATERMRLSRDLHDSVAHTLTVAVVQAESCEQALADDPDSAKAAAVAIQDAGRRGLAELRSVLRVLRDPEADVRAPGLLDVEALATVMSESGLDVTFTRSGDLRSVPDDVGRQLFLVAQESLTNVIKHSAATSAEVRIIVDGASTHVEVLDPGPAIVTGFPPGGHGVNVMTERLAEIGGRVTAASDGAGYRVHATVPLPPKAYP
jgi:signal transduction histidine kinase